MMKYRGDNGSENDIEKFIFHYKGENNFLLKRKEKKSRIFSPTLKKVLEMKKVAIRCAINTVFIFAKFQFVQFSLYNFVIEIYLILESKKTYLLINTFANFVLIFILIYVNSSSVS